MAIAQEQEYKIIDFVRWRKFAAVLSTILILVSIVSLSVNGLKFGLDFTGGTQIDVSFSKPADLNKIREVLHREGLENPVVVLFGSESEVLIRSQGSMQDAALIGLDRELATISPSAELVEIERAQADRDGFTQVFVISGASPDQLRQGDFFKEQYFGNVLFDVRGDQTTVALEKASDIAFMGYILDVLAAETDSEVDLRRSEFVGPQVGEELRDEGGLGVIFALLVVMAYVAVRFQYKFSISAVLGLLHDVIIVLGVFSLFRLDFDLTVLAAVLAVIAYSINNTIVVFDRIRENFRRLRKSTDHEVINISLTQTLERTLVLSLTTMLVLFALFLFGGKMLGGFALALIIGITSGTYTSWYICTAVLVGLNVSKEDLIPTVKEGDDAVDSLP
ncbi:protein translocase subunit SecF [Cellvibrio polysaccharolyticus]|uniref:Protein-export membrane protein SecF n=1 Tax=Cellvibrio polysaccharolyticus TaxID=2082724 RepID=A0A928V6P6_9GAMM|nr:protein translocase subunit SecF [Cellvibrio polysaccharolyticus]MBE8717906.1 protein translocase subunit SecF [Cellvibrio polysaccharolyticus]